MRGHSHQITDIIEDLILLVIEEAKEAGLHLTKIEKDPDHQVLGEVRDPGHQIIEGWKDLNPHIQKEEIAPDPLLIEAELGHTVFGHERDLDHLTKGGKVPHPLAQILGVPKLTLILVNILLTHQD